MMLSNRNNTMKILNGFLFGIALFALAGCSDSNPDSSDTALDEADAESADLIETQTDAELSMDQFAGATFVSANLLEDAERGLTPSHWTVSFTNDMVSWTQSELIELGTFEFAAGSDRVADLSDREINFSGSGNDLIWDSEIYYRISSSQFDSQETLIENFDGSDFNSVDVDDLSLRFEGDQFFIEQQDIIQLGTYSFIDDVSFNTSIGGQDMPAYPLVEDRLLLGSTLYERDFSDLFDSQESLIEFLADSTFRSAGLQQIGGAVDGVASVDFATISFTDNTFMLTAQNGDEAGTVVFLSNNSFTAVFADREAIVEVLGGDILLEGVRYIRQ